MTTSLAFHYIFTGHSYGFKTKEGIEMVAIGFRTIFQCLTQIYSYQKLIDISQH